MMKKIINLLFSFLFAYMLQHTVYAKELDISKCDFTATDTEVFLYIR